MSQNPVESPMKNGPPLRPLGRGGGGGHMAMMRVDKPKNFKNTTKKLWKYTRGYKAILLLVLILAIAGTLFTVIAPKILGSATDIIANAIESRLNGNANAAIDYIAILKILSLLGILYAISSLFSYLQSFVMTGFTQKLTYRLRADISEKINKMPLKYFDSNSVGNTMSRITNDVDTINSSLQQSIVQAITSLTTVVGVLVMMLSINLLMTLTALITIPLTAILISSVVKRSQKLYKEQQSTLGQLNGHIEECYSGHMIIKVFNKEQLVTDIFNAINERLYTATWKSQFISGLIMPISNFIGNLGYIAVCVLGGMLVVKSSITIGGIQAFILYVRQFNQPISHFTGVINIFQSTIAAAERVFDFLEEEEEPTEDEYPIKLEKIKGNVEFDHIKFGYSKDRIIIHDFTASIQSGQIIAIVGPTGAGKTTLINLIMRFYDVFEGSIKVDGVDIKKMKRFDLRKIFGMVLQDAWLFNGSIKENISYGKIAADEKDILNAAKAAQVDHFVHTLPGGYDFMINEDASNVSQGQKQLLTIARAILADPSILILDEATSSVDTRTEILIQKAMKNLMKNKTCFIIAHRLSTIRDADLILVINEGNIVEQGTHAGLMQKDGFYAALYNSQFDQ